MMWKHNASTAFSGWIECHEECIRLGMCIVSVVVRMLWLSWFGCPSSVWHYELSRFNAGTGNGRAACYRRLSAGVTVVGQAKTISFYYLLTLIILTRNCLRDSQLCLVAGKRGLSRTRRNHLRKYWNIINDCVECMNCQLVIVYQY